MVFCVRPFLWGVGGRCEVVFIAHAGELLLVGLQPFFVGCTLASKCSAKDRCRPLCVVLVSYEQEAISY